MNTHHALRLIGLATFGALIAAPSFAQSSSQEGGYYYGGLSLGQSRARIDEERITAGLLGAGLTTTSMSGDEKDTAFRLFGGYQFNRYIGLEGGYFKLGKFGFTSTTSPAGTLTGEIKLQGINLDLVGTLPLTERLSAIGRIGGQYAQARDTFRGTGAVGVLNPNPKKNELNAKLGVGLQYEVNRSFFVRAEGEHYRINDAVGNHGGVNVVSVSLVFPFGREPAPAPRAMAPVYVPPPAPVVAAPPPPPPAPAPVVVEAPVARAVVPPPRRRVSFSTDSIFVFDQSRVGPEGKRSLDAFVEEIKGTRYQTITVEGHADRLGSADYNETLSAKRADVVKAYLVDSGGLDAAKISAVSKGETQPVTGSECVGEKRSKQLIACLQPDRRVEVEVVGTR